jgi:hypothetical protein
VIGLRDTKAAPPGRIIEPKNVRSLMDDAIRNGGFL